MIEINDEGLTTISLSNGAHYTFRRLTVGDIHDMETLNTKKQMTNTQALHWLAAKLCDNFVSWEEFRRLTPEDLRGLGEALSSFLPQHQGG